MRDGECEAQGDLVAAVSAPPLPCTGHGTQLLQVCHSNLIADICRFSLLSDDRVLRWSQANHEKLAQQQSLPDSADIAGLTSPGCQQCSIVALGKNTSRMPFVAQVRYLSIYVPPTLEISDRLQPAGTC